MGQQPLLSGQERKQHLSAAAPAHLTFLIPLKAMEAVSLFSGAVCCLVGSSLPPFCGSRGPDLHLGSSKNQFSLCCWEVLERRTSSSFLLY